MKFETKIINLKDLHRNTGQIPNVPKNPRIIRDNNFRKLKESILQDPEMLELREILVYQYNGKYIIIGGNMRFEALKALQFESAKCKILTDVTAEQLKRIILKDNSAFGDWNFDDLANEWDETLLTACAIDIPTIDDPKIDEEEVKDDNFNPEDVEKNTIVKRGEVWKLGKHFLFCGDCTDNENVKKFMQGRLADLIVTDPPYNVNYEEKLKKLLSFRKNTRSANHIKNDIQNTNNFSEFVSKMFFTLNETIKPGGAVYCFYSSSESKNFYSSIPKSLIWRDTLIWNKNHFSLTHKDYQLKFEPCLYLTKEGKGHYFIHQRNIADVINIAENFDVEKATKEELKGMLNKIFELPTNLIDEQKPLRSSEHPTMKPIKLIGSFIKNSSRLGEIIFDPFGGSGTTLIASEQLKRICYTIEIDEHYCDVIIARWEKLTGGQAVRITEKI